MPCVCQAFYYQEVSKFVDLPCDIFLGLTIYICWIDSIEVEMFINRKLSFFFNYYCYLKDTKKVVRNLKLLSKSSPDKSVKLRRLARFSKSTHT